MELPKCKSLMTFIRVPVSGRDDPRVNINFSLTIGLARIEERKKSRLFLILIIITRDWIVRSRFSHRIRAAENVFSHDSLRYRFFVCTTKIHLKTHAVTIRNNNTNINRQYIIITDAVTKFYNTLCGYLNII